MEHDIGNAGYLTVRVARFDKKGMIPMIDGQGRRLLVDRAELRQFVELGTPVFSECGYRLDLADVDAGRLR